MFSFKGASWIACAFLALGVARFLVGNGVLL